MEKSEYMNRNRKLTRLLDTLRRVIDQSIARSEPIEIIHRVLSPYYLKFKTHYDKLSPDSHLYPFVADELVELDELFEKILFTEMMICRLDPKSGFPLLRQSLSINDAAEAKKRTPPSSLTIPFMPQNIDAISGRFPPLPKFPPDTRLMVNRPTTLQVDPAENIPDLPVIRLPTYEPLSPLPSPTRPIANRPIPIINITPPVEDIVAEDEQPQYN